MQRASGADVFRERAGMFSLGNALLLTGGKDLKAEAVTGTKRSVEKAEKTCEKLSHSSGFIAQGLSRGPS